MACTALTKGRGVDCNRISGGVKFIYFAVLDQVSSFAYDATNELEIDTIDFGGNDIYRYTMPMGVSSVTDTIVGSRENGTIYYTPTANVLFNRLTVQDQEEIKLLGAKSFFAFTFCFTLFFLSFLFPLSQMLYWTIKFPENLINFNVIELLLNTLYLVSLSSLVLLIFAL